MRFVHRHLNLRRAAEAAVLAALVGCAPHLTVEPQRLTGSYHGTTDDGTEIVLGFTQVRDAFRGSGTVAGEPVTLAGAVGWCGAASLAGADGTEELVALELSGGGEIARLDRPGSTPVNLVRTASSAPPVAQGPFTGRYAAAKGRAPLAEVTLTQDGSLLAGIGIVTGDPVGVAGRTTGATSAAGLVTFRDGTQVRWSADLAADGTLTLTGFGDPIALHRRPR